MKGLRFIHPLRGGRLVTVCILSTDCILFLTPRGRGAGPSREQSIVVITTRSSRPVHPVSSSSPRWEVPLGLQGRGDLPFSCPLWRFHAPPQWASRFILDGVAAGARPTSRRTAVLALAAAGGKLRRRRPDASRRRFRGHRALDATYDPIHSEMGILFPGTRRGGGLRRQAYHPGWNAVIWARNPQRC